MARKFERLAQHLGLIQLYSGAWHEPAMQAQRRRAGYMLIVISTALIVLGVVLLVVHSTTAGVVAILVGLVDLAVYVLVTRRNRAREAAAK